MLRIHVLYVFETITYIYKLYPCNTLLFLGACDCHVCMWTQYKSYPYGCRIIQVGPSTNHGGVFFKSEFRLGETVSTYLVKIWDLD